MSPPSVPSETRVAVLVSGGGRSLENLVLRLDERKPAIASVVLVVASQPECGALQRAAAHHIPTRVIRAADFPTKEQFSDAISDTLDKYRVNLVVMAGFLQFYRIPQRYLLRVMNIHPSLLPSFSGRGFYGNRVHRAVLAFGAKVTGATVHFADNEYDHGPIVMQSAVPVEDDDDVDSLAARVFAEECRMLPQAVEWFACGRLKVVHGRRVRLVPPQKVA